MINGEPWPKTPKATQVHPLCLRKCKNAKIQKCKNAKIQKCIPRCPRPGYDKCLWHMCPSSFSCFPTRHRQACKQTKKVKMQNAKLHQEKFLLRCSKQGNNYNQRNICPSSFSPFPTRNRPPKRDACFFYLPSAITKNLTCPYENTNTNTSLIQFFPLWTMFFFVHPLYLYLS